MTDRELMQQALEALEQYVDYEGATSSADKAITALRERLAQPEQEPVAWMYRDSWGTMKLSQIMPPPVGAFPVYTTPPRREWVGLTGEELDLIARTAADLYDAALKSEAKLKEKNGRVDSFLRRLLDPEDLGHAVSHEVRQKVRELL